MNADTRTLYRAFDRLRRVHRRAIPHPSIGSHWATNYSPESRAVVLLALADELHTRGHRDPACLWSAR